MRIGNRSITTAGAGGGVQPATPLECSGLSYPFQKTNSSPYHHPLDGVMRASGKMLFTATQWQELEMQTMIFKYIMASIPVPPQLLSPLSTQSNRMSMGLRFSNGSDLEPWRCRRTDGKKWRCSKDVVLDQKYCERHARKTRSRSRKPVEINKDDPTVPSAANQQTQCSDWFLKNAGMIPVYQSNNQIAKQECSLKLSMQSGGNEMGFDRESFEMAVGMLSGDRGGCEDVFKPYHHWLNQGSWGCLGSGSGSTPGGPLGEALCLGITGTQKEPSSHGYGYGTTTSNSCEGGFVL